VLWRASMPMALQYSCHACVPCDLAPKVFFTASFVSRFVATRRKMVVSAPLGAYLSVTCFTSGFTPMRHILCTGFTPADAHAIDSISHLHCARRGTNNDK
jgi:hypothetical protein